MRKILIVDDEKILLHVAEKILSRHYNIICASSGAEAVNLFRREQPDLVLSDLLMPEMDGYELHQTLQEMSSEPIPFIFMTADESDESESRGFELGAADYIRKPLKADVLLRRVDNIMENLDKIHGLQRAISIDPMTHLLNKSASQQQIDETCKDIPGMMLLIDLDNFKLVNDLYGHAMGDKILIRMAELIRGMTRSSDLVGRVGGDEFIAYLRHMTDEEVIREKTAYLNEQILLSAKELMGEDCSIPLGASIGVARMPEDGADFATLFRKADDALSQVKQCGKHGFRFYGAASETTEKTAQRDITETQRILGERNELPGAYDVPPDIFQGIYRMAVRLTGNYEKEIQFLQFTFASDQPEEENPAADALQEILCKVLRRSDCITRHGKTRLLALLMEAGPKERQGVQERIRHEWEKHPLSKQYSYECAAESL